MVCDNARCGRRLRLGDLRDGRPRTRYQTTLCWWLGPAAGEQPLARQAPVTQRPVALCEPVSARFEVGTGRDQVPPWASLAGTRAGVDQVLSMEKAVLCGGVQRGGRSLALPRLAFELHRRPDSPASFWLPLTPLGSWVILWAAVADPTLSPLGAAGVGRSG